MAVGVQVSTATRSAPSVDQNVRSSTYFVSGQTERGVIDKAQVVNSLTDFEQLYGGYVSYGTLHDDLRMFFEEGGSRAYVARVVGASSSLSTLTLVDRAGSPVNTLRIDALGPGAWGTGITVQVAAGSSSGTYKIIVVYSGTGNVGTETYDYLVTPADAVIQLANSAYVRATDLSSATAAPNNQPAIVSATALSGGSDDRGTVNSASYTTALALFSAGLGSGAVAIPGQSAANVGVGLVAHAVSNNRLALTAPATGRTQSQAISDAASLTAAVTGDEFVGFFWPWIKIPDGTGNLRTVSPEGFVAAKRSVAHETKGPAQAAAGTTYGGAIFVVDVITTTTEDDVNTLNGANVSPITLKVDQNGAVKPTLYGWQSQSSDETNYKLLTSRDTVNYVATASKVAMEEFVYATIDGRGMLFARMEAKETALLDQLRSAGQLFERTDDFGNILDPGYRVDTGPSVNTATTKARNEAHINVSIRPSPSAELIPVKIAKVPVNGAV